MTLILLAVSPSVFSWGMLGLRSSSAKEGVFLLSPRRIHPAWLAVVALISTGIGSISEMPNREDHLKATVILPKCMMEFITARARERICLKKQQR